MSLTEEVLLRLSLRGDLGSFCAPSVVRLDLAGDHGARPRASCGDPRFGPVGEVAGGAALPLESLELLSSWLGEEGVQRVLLGWRGDPLMHPDPVAAIRLLRERSLSVGLQSSLRRTTPEQLGQLLELPLTHVICRHHAGSGPLPEALVACRDPRPRPPVLLVITVGAPAPGEGGLEELVKRAWELGVDELALEAGAPFLPPHRSSTTPTTSTTTEPDAAETRPLIAALGQIATKMLFTAEGGAEGGFHTLAEAPAPEQQLLLGFGRYHPSLSSTDVDWDPARGAFVCVERQPAMDVVVDPRHPSRLHLEFDHDICEQCCRLDRCSVNQTSDRIELRFTQVDPIGPLAADLAQLEADPALEPGPCLVPFATAWIDCQGGVWTCPYLHLDPGLEAALADRPLDNCFTRGSWDACWNGPALEELRQQLLTRPSPPRCCGSAACRQLRQDRQGGELGRPVRRLLEQPCSDLERATAAVLRRPARLIGTHLRERERWLRTRRARDLEQQLVGFEHGKFAAKVQRYAKDLRDAELREQRYLEEITRLRRRVQDLEFSAARPPAPAARVHRRPDDLLLVQAPLWGQEMPPLNLAVLVEFLRLHDVRVSVRDLNIELHNACLGTDAAEMWTIGLEAKRRPEEQCQILKERFQRELDDFADKVLRGDTPTIGFVVNLRNRHMVQHLARVIHRHDPSRVILYGGPNIYHMYHRDELDDSSVSLFVLGEAEETLLEIIRRRRAGAPLTGIPGTIAGPALAPNAGPAERKAAFEHRTPIMDLDSIPFPTYSDFSLERYDGLMIPFSFSRGCINHCRYCIDSVMTRPHRCRGAGHALAEVEHHVRVNKIHFLRFNDLLCNGDVAKLAHFCDLVAERGLEINWNSYAAIRPEMTATLLKKLRRAGCASLQYGFESGSDRVLELMGKRYRTADAAQVIRATTDAGIKASVNIIVGFPGETDDDVEQTCDFLRRNRDHLYQVINLSTLDIQPGSTLSGELDSLGISCSKGIGVWYDDGGNTLEVRNSRLDRVRAAIAELNLPLRIINRVL